MKWPWRNPQMEHKTTLDQFKNQRLFIFLQIASTVLFEYVTNLQLKSKTWRQPNEFLLWTRQSSNTPAEFWLGCHTISASIIVWMTTVINLSLPCFMWPNLKWCHVGKIRWLSNTRFHFLVTFVRFLIWLMFCSFLRRYLFYAAV